MKKYNILQTNPKRKYEGSHYAVTGMGGFEINTQREITINSILQIGKYDLTNALQIIMEKEIFNSKIGVFDEFLQRFSNNSILLETSDFLLTENQIVSLGSLEMMYMDFKKYVYDYFNMKTCFHIFNEKMNVLFDEEELCKMMRENLYTGYIEIKDIHNVIETLIKYNICDNRTNNDVLENGFMNGDIFYIPEGLCITLSVDCGLRKMYKYDLSIRLK